MLRSKTARRVTWHIDLGAWSCLPTDDAATVPAMDKAVRQKHNATG